MAIYVGIPTYTAGYIGIHRYPPISSGVHSPHGKSNTQEMNPNTGDNVDKETYTMAVALLKALETANSIEKFADCRDNVYGDIEKTLTRLGSEVEKMHQYWLDTSEIFTWDDLATSQLRYVVL